MNLQAFTAALQAACPLVTGVNGDTLAVSYSAAPTAAQQQQVAAIVSGWSDPTPERAAPLAALLDPLSAAQRAAITADHMLRLEAEPAVHPGGLLPITNPKVAHAASDLGMTPDAWFTLGGY